MSARRWLAVFVRNAVSFALAIACMASIRVVPRPPNAVPRKVPTQTLTVFAAASLVDAFHDVGARFHEQHPEVAVRFSFAGSQQLAAQIAQGAAADVFASADTRWMNEVQRGDYVRGEPRPFAGNRLVVIVPHSNPARIGRLQDLARRGVKLVIGAEAVPVGAYSRESLAKLSRMPEFRPDFATRVLANVVSLEDQVRSVVGKVQLGEADAGICYRSDVTRAVLPFVRVIDIPEAANVRALYPIAVLAHGGDYQASWEFVDFVCSAAGQEVLRRHGFLAPDASATAP